MSCTHTRANTVKNQRTTILILPCLNIHSHRKLPLKKCTPALETLYRVYTHTPSPNEGIHTHAGLRSYIYSFAALLAPAGCGWEGCARGRGQLAGAALSTTCCVLVARPLFPCPRGSCVLYLSRPRGRRYSARLGRSSLRCGMEDV